MIQYWKKNNTLYAATTGDSEVYVILNETIASKDLNMINFYQREGYQQISRSEFHKAYSQTMAMIASAYSRLNMMETDSLLPLATEQEKQDEAERFPADDEHLYRGEHLELDC